MEQLSPEQFAARVDAALWKPAATTGEIEGLCKRAREQKLRAVCMNTSRVTLAAARLEDTNVKVVALTGFPFGGMDADAKRYEAETAIDLGAQEIEVVLDHGKIKDGAHAVLLRELRDLVETADELPVCVVVETSLLTRAEISTAIQLVRDSGAQAISTGTDFPGNNPITLEEVQMFVELAGPKLIVKATGGVRDAHTALALLAAGAARVGTLHGQLK